MNNSDICIFNLSDVSKTERKCFRSNRLLIEYTCDGKKTKFKANTFFLPQHKLKLCHYEWALDPLIAIVTYINAKIDMTLNKMKTNLTF